MAALAAAALVLVSPLGAADADSADPGISFEGWFAVSRPENPTVPVPCLPPPASNPVGCGPVNPAPVPAPQSPATGGYVVASAGGDSGRSTTSGDSGWTAFQWDLFSFLDVSVSKFVVTLSHAPDNRADFGPPVFQGCNIVAPWAAEPGANPWENRPIQDCSLPIVPVQKDGKWVFDVTSFAQTWVEGTGYGLVIVPGQPDKSKNLTPFQYTFAGYFSTAPNAAEVKPKVDFEYTPAIDDSGFGSGGGFGGGTDFFEETTFPEFAADPGIDIDPNDVGSEPVDDGTTPTTSGEPVALPPVQRAAADTGFPLSALLLLPLAALGFWGVGTALGPAGDPAPRRKGGVSRMLEQRRAQTDDQRIP